MKRIIYPNQKVFKSFLILITLLLSNVFNSIHAQTYDSGQPGYGSLAANIHEDADYVYVEFNLAVDDDNNPTYANHLHHQEIYWNGNLIYGIEHKNLNNFNWSTTDFNVGVVSDPMRYNNSGDYREWYRIATQNGVTVSYPWQNNVFGKDVQRVEVKILKKALNVFGAVSSEIKLSGTYWYKFTNGNNGDEVSGNHLSQTFSVFTVEEDNSGNDEVDFTATLNSDEGCVELKFRTEKKEGEHVFADNMDHMASLYIGVRNDSRSVPIKGMLNVGHVGLGANPQNNRVDYDGIHQADFTYGLDWPSQVEVVDGAPYYTNYQPDGDGYFTVKHYYDKESLGDDLYYYISGTYYAKDFYAEYNIVNVDFWAAGNAYTITPNVDYTMPDVTGFDVVASTTNCEMNLSWNAYTSFGDASRNRVGVYRDNILLAEVPLSSLSYTDTDIEQGKTYSYQIRSTYVRAKNGSLEGNLTGAKTAIIPLPETPSGLTAVQGGSCSAAIDANWNWSTANPQFFVLQRKTNTEVDFTTISNTISGSVRTYNDNNNIVSGEVYSYRIAAIDGPCSARGLYTDVYTLTGDTIDLTQVIDVTALETSKGYFDDRTELFWETTGVNDQYLQQFKIYAREVGSTTMPTLLQTVNENVRTWFHTTGEAGVAYEYFIVGERVVTTPCGSVVTKSFEIASLNGITTVGDLPGEINLPANGKGVAYAIGFRYPTGIVNGNITYSGGVAVPDVKVIAERYSGKNGNSIYLNGTNFIEIPNSNSLTPDTSVTVSAWFKFEDFNSTAAIFEKELSYGIHKNGNDIFFFIQDQTGTNHYVVVPLANNFTIGTWANVTCSYSQATKTMKFYVNGELKGVNNATTSGITGLNSGPNDYVSIGRRKSCQCSYFQGYIAEVKIYNRALSDIEVNRASGAVSATDENGLMAYWKMLLGAGDKIYDASHTGSDYHKNNGTLYGATWSNDIPSVTQLGFAGYTDANGNYSIRGIGYTGVGENFNIIPTNTLAGAVHEFDPSTRTLFIGAGNAVHNNIDFEDVSSFSFSGNVRFDFYKEIIVGVGTGGKISGSDGVKLYLDGTTVLTGANGQPFETDENGFFNVDIPIGHHFIEFRKNNHSFDEGGRFPITGTYDFQESVSGVEIWDTTKHILIGKVVGGTFEAEKPVGMNQTVNNIGQAKFTLTSEDGKIIRDILTDNATGEYSIDLPPKKYTSSDVEWAFNNVDIVPSGDITPIDLATVIAYNGTDETDSIFVNDTTFTGIDSTFYHVRKDFIYRVVPELVISDTNSLGISGEAYYQFDQGDSTISVDLTTLPYPTYFSAKHYVYRMKAAEIYTNLDNGIEDTVLVTDGQLMVNNNIGIGYYLDENGSSVEYNPTSSIAIENGELIYRFMVTDPNINEVSILGLEHTSFTKQMSVNLTVGNYTVNWVNPADPTNPFRVYIVGAKAVGTSFVTVAPAVVDFVLRDPPGSQSYAFWEEETSHTISQEFYVGGFANASLEAGLGVGNNTLVGGGIMGIGETASAAALATVAVKVDAEVGEGGEFSQTTTFNNRIETNSAAEELGQSDIFVASSQNLQSGLAAHIRPVPVSQCGSSCYGDTMYSITGDAYRMTRVGQNYLNPVGVPTYLNFTQAHIVTVLIPDFEDARNTFLTGNGSYTSNLPPNDPMYGTNNDDPLWDSLATTSNYIRTEILDYDGPSYTFAWANDSLAVDSVRAINQQIRLWKEALANNEIEKWMAKMYNTNGENISMSSGNTLTQSKTTATSSYKYSSYELSSSISAGFSAEFQGWGFGMYMKVNAEVGLKTSGKNGQQQETSLTTGYTIHDDDAGDAISFDVFPSEAKNGPIFSVVGGQSTCPFEDEIIMVFATPAYIQTLIDIQTGVMNKANEEALAYGVIGASSDEAEQYGVVDQIQSDVSRLQALLTALQGGDVILSNATLQRDKPSMLINGAKTAQVFNVPADQAANLTLLLNNDSESNDAQNYEVEVLDGTNPNGLTIKIDGAQIVNALGFWVPGGSSIQKIMTVERGPFEYDYTGVGIIIHSECQWGLGNDALIVDTVYFDVSFLPTCTEIEIVSPDDNWTANSSFNDQLPLTIGGYDVNYVDFQKVKVQYKPSSSSSWTLLESYYRDTTVTGWAGEPTLPQNGNTFTYNWDLGLLPDANYDLRAVATCALAETNSEIHSGIVDRLRPETFGVPQPSDGILTPGEEISIQFNETINAGILSTANFDVRGVLNAGDIRHDASVYFGGIPTSNIVAQQVNTVNTSFTVEMYVKRTQNGIDQAVLSQGLNSGTELSIGFNTSDQIIAKFGGQEVTGISIIDNNWHHITFVYDLDNQNGEVFLDAVLEGSNNNFIPATTQKEDVYVGVSKSGSAANFEGNIHELRIWNKALTSGEINITAVTRMMGNEAGLLHNWEMEEAKGTLANDKVRGKHAAMSATWVVEPVGYGLRLNGDVDQAELSPVAFTGAEDYTVEFWFKSDGGADEIILSNGTGDTSDVNTSGWALGINSTGNFVALSNNEVLSSGSSVLDGQWHHAAIVSKSIGNTVLYVDAIEEMSITNDSLNGFAGPGLWIGQRGWYVTTTRFSDKQYTGSIDEIRIWNSARTLDQIDRDRFNKLTGDEPGLREYYGFDTYVTSQGVSSVTSTVLNGAINNGSQTDTLMLAGTANLDQVTPTVKLKRPVTSIPFTYSVNNDQIIITPVIDDWKIENTQLDFTVSYVQDLNGNYIESPITWAAYIDRNQVVWQDAQFDFEEEKGTEINFTSNVVNNSGQTFAYTISNVPDWLIVSPTSGSAGPLSSTPISFTVPDNVNAGTYQQDILLTTVFGYDEKLEINVKIKETPPVDWMVEPSDFQYSMDVIGQIAFDGVISRNDENMLGAFVNGQCRGAAPLEYVSAYDNYQVFLSIYSNQTAGEEIEYKVWDATTGNVHVGITHTLPTTTFVSNAFYGMPSAPELFDANDYVAGSIDVPQGWKWVSFNLEGTDLDTVNNLLESLSPSNNDLFKTRDNIDDGFGNYTQYPRFDSYTANNGWLGSLSQGGGANVKSSYKLMVSTAGTIEYSGVIVDPLTDTVHVVEGWNYLGYPGQKVTSITEAMNNYTASNGDVLKSQYASAIYDAAMGWIGSLDQLEPNEGYMLSSGVEQEFTFPLMVTKSSVNVSVNASKLNQSPWTVERHKYPSNMTIVAHIANDDEFFTKYNSNGGLVGAFVNGECRGVTFPIFDNVNNQYIYMLTVSGDFTDERIDFKFIDLENDFTYNAFELVDYSSEGLVGEINNPVELTLEKSLASDNAVDVSIYPNPFHDELTIDVLLQDESNVVITLEDISGRLVEIIANSNYPKGMSKVIFKKGNLPTGLYLINITSGKTTYKEKVVITK